MNRKINKIYTALLIFALLSIILVVFGAWPLLKGIEKDSADLISAKNNIVALAEQIGEIENFKKNYDNYKPALEKMDQLFVDSADPVDFIKFLENTALNNQISSQISLPPYSQDPKAKNPNFIMLQFISKGSFSGMLGFAKDIETGPYLIEIENLTIQNSQEGKNKVEATFKIKVFTK